MRFNVRHETAYRYSTPVVLGSHVLRLNPRGEHQLAARALTVWPTPRSLHDERDDFGNLVTRVDFDGRPTSELVILSTFEVLTVAPAPAREDARDVHLPLLPPRDAFLAGFAATRPTEPAVAAFASAVLAEAGSRPFAFLDHLCRTIYARADRHVRPTGDAQSPTETLTTWRGACRDYTVLFLAVVRSLGLAGRFCSGYQAAAETPDGRRYLHAWPEVHVPCVGWCGWDPTHGIPVGAGHVALCAAPEQAGTMPVVGSYSFEGRELTSTLDFSVNITTS